MVIFIYLQGWKFRYKFGGQIRIRSEGDIDYRAGTNIRTGYGHNFINRFGQRIAYFMEEAKIEQLLDTYLQLTGS